MTGVAATRPLTIVVVHWNQPDHCLATLDAFADQGVPVRFAVVDNASTSGNRDRLASGIVEREGRLDIELIEAGANLGFGGAANLGFRRWLDGTESVASAPDDEWVALIPHDAMPDRDCLRTACALLADKEHGGLASGEFVDGCIPVVDEYFGGMLLPGHQSEDWETCGYPHGTLLFARAGCLRAIGLFDESFFAYCEEADLGERARRAGWDIGLLHGAVVRNPSLGSSIAANEYLQLRNTLVLVRRHFGRYRAFIRTAMVVGDTAYRVLRPTGAHADLPPEGESAGRRSLPHRTLRSAAGLDAPAVVDVSDKRQPSPGEISAAWLRLGVRPEVGLAAAHEAYRRLARVAHPDAGGSVERMAELNDAWATVRRAAASALPSASALPAAEPTPRPQGPAPAEATRGSVAFPPSFLAREWLGRVGRSAEHLPSLFPLLGTWEAVVEVVGSAAGPIRFAEGFADGRWRLRPVGREDGPVVVRRDLVDEALRWDIHAPIVTHLHPLVGALALAHDSASIPAAAANVDPSSARELVDRVRDAAWA